METKIANMNAEQKMDMARRVINLIEQAYPEAQYCGQEEVLVLAYHASTGTHYLKQLMTSNC